MKNRISIIGTFILLFISSFAFSQGNPGQQDPLAAFFYPPELIMQHQNKIDLSNDQKENIMASMESAQGKFNRLQWELQTEMENFKGILAAEKVEETSALAQLEKILALEKEIKKAQITLMVQIKNLLSGEQKKILDDLKH